jgi:acetate kinase
MAILAVNAGSSSLKFSIYPIAKEGVQASILVGSVQGLEPGGSPSMSYTHSSSKATQALSAGQSDPFEVALKELKHLLTQIPNLPPIQAVAHRIVHGGSEFTKGVISTPAILEKLAELNSLAPLHQPHNLQGVIAFTQAFEGVPQVLCFDTAYHQTLSDLERSFAIPQSLTNMGVRKYGFHGLSYEYIISTLVEHTALAQGRVLMAHLGNGASLCASLKTHSIATTMGFSALDGLMMGTRAGALDAGVILYLMEQGHTHDEIQRLLYQQSGLLGVSGLSADMRRLRTMDQPLAKKAIDLFVYRVVRESGAMISCLQGLDVLAFSGGIGEHDVLLRKAVCEQLSWMGIKIDDTLNQTAVAQEIVKISSPTSAVQVWVIPTDEGKMAAKQAQMILQLNSNPS